MAYSPIEDRYLETLTQQQFPDMQPQDVATQPSMDGVQLAMGGSGAGQGRIDRPISDVPMALMDMGAATVKGATQGFVGLPGDLEGIGRLLLDKMGVAVGQDTVLPKTDDIKKWLDQNVGQVGTGQNPYESIGEVMAPGGQIKAVKAVGRGAKALAPKAAEMIVNATEKTGVPVRGLGIVEPNGKTLPIIPVDKVQRQKNYKTWAEGADIKTESGEPKVLYHATTHDFDTFSLQRANPENHYGKGFYLTDSVDDANANYAGVGPDLKQRIELRSERLADEFMDMDEQDVMDSIQAAGVDMNKYFSGGKTFAELDSKQSNEVLMAVAEKELKGHDGMIMPVFAKMKNPVKVGTKDETVFSIETQFDDAGDVIDESGNGIDLLNAIREVADEYNMSDRDIQRALSSITDQMYDGIRAGDVDRILREEVTDVYTPDGEYAGPGQFIADVFQRMGFDGIEMNAEKYFGPRQGAFGTKLIGMEGVQGAKHYILFDSKSIKSAVGNNGKFDPRDPNILHGAGAASVGTGATMQDKEKK